MSCNIPGANALGYNVPQNGLSDPLYAVKPSDCSTKLPVDLFYSTSLNNYIGSYSALRDRIARTLGAPMIPLQVHEDQVNENIAIALEMYSKYAGYTKEALIFDSKLYEPGRGIRLDSLFTLSKTIQYWRNDRHQNPGNMYHVANMVLGDPYAPYKAQPAGTNAVALPTCGLQNISVVKDMNGNYARLDNPDDFQLLNSYDYMLNDYRKVVNVIDFTEGSNGGINTLFSVEQSLAQQAYNSYALGNFGFDIISWYAAGNYLKDRTRLLAQEKSFKFDKRSQYLQLWPEPAVTKYSYTGIVACYVERSIQDMLKENWVYQYATALTKINLGYVRSNFTGAQLFGGVSINSDVLQHGLQEKEKLEDMLYKGANPGHGQHAASFFIG